VALMFSYPPDDPRRRRGSHAGDGMLLRRIRARWDVFADRSGRGIRPYRTLKRLRPKRKTLPGARLSTRTSLWLLFRRRPLTADSEPRVTSCAARDRTRDSELGLRDLAVLNIPSNSAIRLMR
jgi:hypothetical protein